MRTSYLRGSAGYVLVVDGTRRETLENAVVLQNRSEETSARSRSSSWSTRRTWPRSGRSTTPRSRSSASAGWPAFKTSAKTGDGVESFLTLARRMAAPRCRLRGPGPRGESATFSRLLLGAASDRRTRAPESAARGAPPRRPLRHSRRVPRLRRRPALIGLSRPRGCSTAGRTARSRTPWSSSRARGSARPARASPIPPDATALDLGDATLVAGVHRLAHAPDGRGVGELARRLLRGAAPPRGRAGAHRAGVRAQDARAGIHDGPRRRARTTRSTSGLRNAIDRGLVPGPRMLVARDADRRDRRPLRPDGLSAGDVRSGVGPGEGNHPRRRRGPAGRAARTSSTAPTSSRCARREACCRSRDDVSAPQLTDEELAAIVDEAHRLGKKTAAHAHGDLAARAAVKAGIDSIEHGSFLTDETLALMKAKGTYLVPTLLAGEWTGGKAEKFPPRDRRQGARRAGGAIRHVPAGAEERRQDRVRDRRRRFAARAQRRRSSRLMVGLGMTPAAALRSAGPGGGGSARSRRPDRHPREGQGGGHRRRPRRPARRHPRDREGLLRDEGREDRPLLPR